MKTVDFYEVLQASSKRWNPPFCPRFFYPEDIRREFLQTIFMGKWWGWLPGWAHPLQHFSKEVEIVAKALQVERVEFAIFLIQNACPLEVIPVYEWFDPLGPQVPVWEIVQSVESWIIYDLHPLLHDIKLQNFDGVKN
jgi:hypothetical protein